MNALWCALLLAVLPDDGVAESIRHLGDDSAEVRQAAVQKLKAQGRPILPDLERALPGERDPEVRARIVLVINFLTRVQWRTDLPTALKAAASEQKPLLVFSTLGPVDGFL